MKYLLIWPIYLFCFFSLQVNAQQKRPLNHSDYDHWKSVNSEKISKDGKWVGYKIDPQDGDSRFEVANFQNEKQKLTIDRVSQWSFTHDNAFVVAKVVPQKDSVKHLKLLKTKADQMPKDSLYILSLADRQAEKFERVKSFKVPEKNGSWIAIHFEKELPEKKKPEDANDSTALDSPKEKPKKTDGTKLLLRSSAGDITYQYHRVKDYGFSENGDFFYYIKAEEDTLKNAGVFVLNLASGVSKIVDVGKQEYQKPTFSRQGKYFAFLATEDSAESKKPYFDLFLYEIQNENLSKIAEKGTRGVNGMVSKNGQLKFSHDESRLFFGTAPDYVTFAYEDDTTILDNERVKLDIWGWQDNEIQPMQLKNLSRDKNKSYLTVYHIRSKKIVPLEDKELPQISLDKKVKHNVALGYDQSPYRRNYSWDIQIGRDLYLVDIESGNRRLIRRDVPGFPQLSPEAKFIYWYDNRDSSWMAYNIRSRTLVNLTQPVQSVFYNELHDSPSLPSSYGAAGWLKNDAAILIYDRYDIWKIDPTARTPIKNITQGEGRKQNIVYRRQRLDPEEESIDPNEAIVLTGFGQLDKRNGFFSGDISGNSAPSPILYSDHRYLGLTKAKDAPSLMVRRSTFQEYADLYATDIEMKSLRKISDANPQQSQVNWGTVELVDYLANDGTPLQGLLFKPEDFDASVKYPLMVYFYERNSDGLHLYRAPAPSASTINIPFFVSNGYVVFVPDIKYDLGLPGPSAYNCIIPGVQVVVSKGFVDPKRMAIQGQSWGGYQVAYLITQTDMFRAAGSGAPVVNMTSAYGGIRWGTGMSRMFQYEQAQSRIGGSLWEKPLYYWENSPLFFMDRVNTPVLIMHNDEDGAVPWYQGIEMFMALKRLNKPAWLLQYNGEDHNLRQRKNRKDLSIRLSQFFDHYLKDAPAPLWMTEGLPAVEKGRTLKYELESD